jgi:2-oxoglutarate dehydrogenase E2 component (dihydrolipoamide succinyltransferase)
MSKIEILVPVLGESVTEATVAKWHKNCGDILEKDEVIVELETDKITLEVSAPEGGQLSEILCNTGDNVRVGAVLGAINTSISSAKIVSSIETKSDNLNIKESLNPNIKDLIKHPSPAAQVILCSNNIEASSINGTGKDGRITKADAIANVELQIKHIPSLPVAATNQTIALQPITIQSQINRETRVKMTKLRQTISKRLKSVQDTAAILTTFNEIDMYEVMKLRSEYQEEFQKKHSVKLGFMSFFVKAVITALKEFPVINSEVNGDEIIYKHFYDIGIAVGTENGLVVPVLRNTDELSLANIEKEIGNLGKKARDGKLSISDMSGGTFTITNGGTYGSLLSTPIINPPQSAILGMHNIVQRPVGLPNGEIALRPMMYVALSYDHRIIDGKEAVQFLVKVKTLIEMPLKFLLQ